VRSRAAAASPGTLPAGSRFGSRRRPARDRGNGRARAGAACTRAPSRSALDQFVRVGGLPNPGRGSGRRPDIAYHSAWPLTRDVAAHTSADMIDCWFEADRVQGHADRGDLQLFGYGRRVFSLSRSQTAVDTNGSCIADYAYGCGLGPGLLWAPTKNAPTRLQAFRRGRPAGSGGPGI
jgi:hypothetical protein